MKILVLGASGMAGHVITFFLREKGFDVDTLSARNALDKNTHLIDVTDIANLRSLLDKNQYGIVVNCIGLLVRQSEESRDLAIYLNAYLPRFLESYYKNSKTRVIHISTDGVFSGINPPYREESTYDGESFYGRTKALGEINNAKDLTFRMSIIGPDMNEGGAGLFNWFFRQKGEISGYDNVIWNGITTIELAKAIKEAVEQKITGVYHLVPNENISKLKLLQLFKEVFERKDIKIKPAKGSASNTTLINTRKDFRYQVPDYKVMVHDMKTWMDSHKELYRHYYGQRKK